MPYATACSRSNTGYTSGDDTRMPSAASTARRSISKTLIAGIAAIALAIGSIYGNYVQWSDAVQAKATVLNADVQWVLRGTDYLNLRIEYEVNGATRQAEVSALPKHVNAGDPSTLDVLYRRNSPERVISSAVLQEKRRMIPWMFTAGAVLSAVGLWFQSRPSREKSGVTQV